VRTLQVNAVRDFGGPTVTIKLHGNNYDEASDEAKRLVKEEGFVLIHPFDDPEVLLYIYTYTFTFTYAAQTDMPRNAHSMMQCARQHS
jgi:hypothetical protein